MLAQRRQGLGAAQVDSFKVLNTYIRENGGNVINIRSC